MKINIKGTGITLTPEIRAYLERRLESIRKFFLDEGESSIIDIELGKTTAHHQTGDIFRAEINIHVRKNSFRAVSEGEYLYSAIDDVKDEIFRVLSTNKEKRNSLMRRGGQKIKAILRGLKH